MDDRVCWDVPKEVLGGIVQLNEVGDLLQPEGGSKSEAVGENNNSEDAQVQNQFVLL